MSGRLDDSGNDIPYVDDWMILWRLRKILLWGHFGILAFVVKGWNAFWAFLEDLGTVHKPFLIPCGIEAPAPRY